MNQENNGFKNMSFKNVIVYYWGRDTDLEMVAVCFRSLDCYVS